MSVALLITRDDDEAADRLIPVATQSIFCRCWLPGAVKLGLEWIKGMETGIPVGPEDRDEVVQELARLRGWMIQHLGPDAYELQRLDRLVQELSAVEFVPGLEVFIG